MFFRWFGCPLGLSRSSSADHGRNEWLYFDWFLLRWSLVILFFFLEEGWHCVFYLPALNLPKVFICTPLSHDKWVPWWELCPFLSRACRLWKGTASSFAYTLSLPGEKRKSRSLPSFTFNASPFIFCNSFCVESAFLITLFASCICTIHSLWGHFYYSRRVVICIKSEE